MRLYLITLALQCWCLHAVSGNPQVYQNSFQPLANYRKPYHLKHFVLGKKEMDIWNRKQSNGVRGKPLFPPKMVPSYQPKRPIVKSKPSNVGKRNEDAPGAYSWGYRWIDEYGTQMFREEMADGRGTVRGRYSFREANGLLRIVEYVSDDYGFRTRIRSNEPGLISSNPANAQIIRFEDENDIPERYRFV